MSTPFPIVPNNAVSALAANYTAGSGVMSVNPGDGAKYGTPTPERPVYITAVSQNTNLYTIFRCTGRSTDLLTGLVAINATSDRNYVVGDPIRVSIVGQHFEDLYGAVNAIEGSGSVLPSQTGNTGKVLTTDGTSASWGTFVGLPTQTGNSGKYLTTNGTAASWVTLVGVLPTQTGNTGKYLTTDGTSASWSTIASALPTQTGNTGKYLTTDGTNASWVTLASTLPTQTGHNGKYLTTDGTSASWVTLASTLPTQTGNTGKYLTTDGTSASWTTLTATSLLPSQTGNTGKVLTTDGTNVSWGTAATGTVTSVALAAPAILSVTGSPVTGAGTLTLALANQNANLVFSGPSSGGAAAPTFRALAAADVPDLDAAKITSGTLALAQGGTGQASASAAINALVPTQTGNSGKYLTTNGTAVSWGTVAGGSGGLTKTPAATADNTVQPTSASVQALVLQCITSQSAPLAEFWTSGGVLMSQVSKDGYFGWGVTPTTPIHIRGAANTDCFIIEGANGLGSNIGYRFRCDSNRRAALYTNGPMAITWSTDFLQENNFQETGILYQRPAAKSSGTLDVTRHYMAIQNDVTGTVPVNCWVWDLTADTGTSTGARRMFDYRVAGVSKSGMDNLGRHLIATSAGPPSGTPPGCALVYDTTNKKLYCYNPATSAWESSAAFT